MNIFFRINEKASDIREQLSINLAIIKGWRGVEGNTPAQTTVYKK